MPERQGVHLPGALERAPAKARRTDAGTLKHAEAGYGKGEVASAEVSRHAPRTTAEVFDSHLALRQQHRLEDDIAANYADDVTVLTLTGVYRGHDGVRACAAELQHYFPDGDYCYKVRLVEGEVAFLAWSGRSSAGHVRDGADTFLIRDGRILVQTIHYTVDTG